MNKALDKMAGWTTVLLGITSEDHFASFATGRRHSNNSNSTSASYPSSQRDLSPATRYTKPFLQLRIPSDFRVFSK
jgi:hypothetical protein